MKRIISALRISVALCLASLGGRANAADAVSTATNAVSQVQRDSAIENTFRRALIEEESSQNLAAAIKDYQEVVARLDARREMEATAIFRLGECYRRQRLTNDAVAHYERILSDFADQSSLVALSQQNLAALGSTPKTSLAPALSNAARQEQQRLLGEEIGLVEKKLANEQKQLENGTLDQEAHLATQRELLRLKRELAALGEEPAARQEQRRLLEEEMGLVETKLAIRQKQIEVGAAAPEALWETQRQLLELKRQQAALDTGQPALNAATATDSGAATATDEEQKEIRRIQEMVRNSPDLINAPGADGKTPLASAASRGQLLVAQFLLEHGADVNRQGRNDQTPLHLAAANGHKGMVELLLSRDATVDARATAGWTPLYDVAGRGFKAVAETLLAHKADVNARANDGRTPLHRAADAGKTEMVELLLSKGADVNAKCSYDFTPLILAVAGKHLAMTKLLLANKAEVNTACNGPYGGTSQTRGYYPLHFAATAGDNPMLRLLLDNGANPNVQVTRPDNTLGPTPLLVAVQASHSRSIETGLQRLRDSLPNTMPAETLRETVEILLQHKANPNIPDEHGTAPLIYALGDTEMLKRLLDAGAEVNVKDGQGNTPLALAAGGGSKGDAELLLAHGADVNAPGANGNTPLHWAVRERNKDLVELLLAHKADPNLRNRDGLTPLDLTKPQPARQGTTPGPVRPPPPALVVSTSNQAADELAILLQRAGAENDLPRLDRIEVRRPSANFSAVVFTKGTNDWNRFSLLELLAAQYDLISVSPVKLPSKASYDPHAYWWRTRQFSLNFPDLTNLTIRRPTSDGKGWTGRKVDLTAAFKSGDCAGDVWLQWGDVVEIPEADHGTSEQWPGLSDDALALLKKCLTRRVEVVLKDEATKLALAPHITLDAGKVVALRPSAPFMLVPALFDSKVLLASSDLSRVVVKRRDAATGQMRQWLLDCWNSQPPPDFWLRDGDVVEVPEKE